MAKASLDPKDWIRRAQKRFDTASREADYSDPDIESVCLLCHHSAELILKAYIIAQTKDEPQKNHDLCGILRGCRLYSADFDSIYNNCSDLMPHLGLARYPVEIESTKYDMEQALKDTSQILEFTKSKLKDLGYELPPDMSVPISKNYPTNILTF